MEEISRKMAEKKSGSGSIIEHKANLQASPVVGQTHSRKAEKGSQAAPRTALQYFRQHLR